MTAWIDNLNSSGQWLVTHLWPSSVEWAILAAVVIATLTVLRPGSPALRHWFWCLVLVKPLATILVASPLTFYGLLETEPSSRAVVAVASDETAAAHRRVDAASTESPRAYPSTSSAIEQAPPRRESSLNRNGAVAMVYLLVAAALGLRLLVGHSYVSYLRRTSRPQRDGKLHDLLSHTARRLGMRCRVKLAVSELAHGPVLAGILHPTILISDRMAGSLSARHLEHIFAHELTHLRRLDNLVSFIQHSAEVVLWFHPVVWLCGRALRHEAEAACDDAVMRRFEGPAGYADTLTRVAELQSGLARRLPVNTLLASEPNLAVRVRRILHRPVRRMTIGLTAASVGAFIVIAMLGLPTVRARSAARTPTLREGTAERQGVSNMTLHAEFGFRFDPMSFVENDQSIVGARVRTFVFGDPSPGDDKIIQDELDTIKVFEATDPEAQDATSGQPSFRVSTENLLRLVQLGANAEHPEVRRALELIDRVPRRSNRDGILKKAARLVTRCEPEEPSLSGDPLHALCLLDRADHPVVHDSLLAQIGNADKWIRPLSGCPWTPSGGLPALWAARDLEDTAPVVERALRGILDELADTGCLGFMEPMGFVNCAAHIDHPIAREILIKQIPLILRAQQSDGGWGKHTFIVLAALKKHGLLDELRGKAPLPPDWRVVRSIPAPDGKLWGFVWDGQRLWTGVRESNEAVAISPDDGRVLNRVTLPEGHGRWLGWWSGKLAVTQGSPEKGDPKRLLQIDPSDGSILEEVSLSKLEHVGGVAQVGGELWVLDAFFGWRCVLDANAPRMPRETQDENDLPCPLPVAVNAAGDDALWFVDAWSPWIMKTDRAGRLLDWGERPFPGLEGVVWDGRRLWAIDQSNRRICVIEKTETAPRALGRSAGTSVGS